MYFAVASKTGRGHVTCITLQYFLLFFSLKNFWNRFRIQTHWHTDTKTQSCNKSFPGKNFATVGEIVMNLGIHMQCDGRRYHVLNLSRSQPQVKVKFLFFSLLDLFVWFLLMCPSHVEFMIVHWHSFIHLSIHPSVHPYQTVFRQALCDHLLHCHETLYYKYGTWWELVSSIAIICH